MTVIRRSPLRAVRRLKRFADLSARRYAELREQPVQVRAHRPVREIKPLADLSVREACGRQLRDLELLRAQLGPRLGNATARALAGGTHLATRALGKAPQPKGVEDAGGLAKRCTRIQGPSLPAQPPSVRELRTRCVERPARGARPHRGVEPLLGRRAIGEERSSVSQLYLEMRRARVRRSLLPLTQ